MINSSISEQDYKEYLELIEQGMSQRSACEVLSLSRSSVQRYIKKWNELSNSDVVNTTVDDKVNTKAPNKPKVLFYDIETTLAKSYHFQQWQVNLSQKQKVQESHLLSVAWCWNDNDVHGDILSKQEVLEHDDERLVLKLWRLLDNADIIIGHNCMEENSKVLNGNLDWIPIKDLSVGDKILGFEEGKNPFTPFRDRNGTWTGQGGNRKVEFCEVTEHTTIQKEAFEVLLSDGSKVITTDDHMWLGKTSPKGVLTWIKTKDLISRNAHIVKYMDVWDRDLSYKAGWLAGFIDGEGSLMYSERQALSGMQICQNPTTVWEKCLKLLEYYNIPHSEPKNRKHGLGSGICEYIYTHGKWKTLELIGRFDITKFKEQLKHDKLGTLTSCGRPMLKVVSVTPVGMKNIVILGTSSNTYFSEGFAMHNCKKFDNKKANSYFLKYGLNPPSPYRTIDTLQIAKSKFALPFNNLDYIAEYLNVGRKISTDVQLWIDCDKGNQEALDLMLDYNKQDVVVLRDVYKRLLTWGNNNVNMNTYNDDKFSCTNCGSDKVEMITNKFVHTNTNKYLAYRCNDCGSVMRANKSGLLSDKLVIV